MRDWTFLKKQLFTLIFGKETNKESWSLFLYDNFILIKKNQIQINTKFFNLHFLYPKKQIKNVNEICTSCLSRQHVQMFLVERVKWVKKISIQGEGPRYYHLISS